MSDLRELYQQTILDHTRKPRNFRQMPDANRAADDHNPLCGDKLKLFLKIDDQGVIADISFVGAGCAISTASASMMTEFLRGRRVVEVAGLFEKFHDMVTRPLEAQPEAAALGKLAVFAGVREFPVRVKCATLPWHTLQAAIKKDQAPVSTE